MTPLLVNFGGPRSLEEILPFLEELLLDRDVIWTPWPNWLHKAFFRRIAKKRAKNIEKDYAVIGGKSPIFFDTETLAKNLHALTFHRYLPATHRESLAAIENCPSAEIRVFPLFPQFTYATTGSIARFLAKHLSPTTLQKLRWIPAYPTDPSFVQPFVQTIRTYLQEQHLQEEETLLLFSAHSVPKAFIDKLDPYQQHCEASFEALRAHFPKSRSLLSYQSQFGKQEWIGPSTLQIATNTPIWCPRSYTIVVVPLSFPSDHIETLFEVEEQYLPLFRQQGYRAYRCPALNLRPSWIEGIQDMLHSPLELLPTNALVRNT